MISPFFYFKGCWIEDVHERVVCSNELTSQRPFDTLPSLDKNCLLFAHSSSLRNPATKTQDPFENAYLALPWFPVLDEVVRCPRDRFRREQIAGAGSLMLC